MNEVQSPVPPPPTDVWVEVFWALPAPQGPAVLPPLTCSPGPGSSRKRPLTPAAVIQDDQAGAYIVPAPAPQSYWLSPRASFTPAGLLCPWVGPRAAEGLAAVVLTSLARSMPLGWVAPFKHMRVIVWNS